VNNNGFIGDYDEEMNQEECKSKGSDNFSYPSPPLREPKRRAGKEQSMGKTRKPR